MPRVIWVVINGFMYKCSPESLRPVTEDEGVCVFKELAQQLHSGALPDELESVTPARGGPAGRFDLPAEPQLNEDFHRSDDSDVEVLPPAGGVVTGPEDSQEPPRVS